MLLLQFSLVVRVFPSPMVLTVRLSEVRYRGCMGHPRARLGVNLYALSCLCCRTIVPLPSSYSHKSCWSVPSSSSSSSSCGAIPPLYGVHRSCCRCSGIRLYGPNAVVADILGRVPSRRSQLLWLSAAALAPGSSIGSAMVSAGIRGCMHWTADPLLLLHLRESPLTWAAAVVFPQTPPAPHPPLLEVLARRWHPWILACWILYHAHP